MCRHLRLAFLIRIISSFNPPVLTSLQSHGRMSLRLSLSRANTFHTHRYLARRGCQRGGERGETATACTAKSTCGNPKHESPKTCPTFCSTLSPQCDWTASPLSCTQPGDLKPDRMWQPRVWIMSYNVTERIKLENGNFSFPEL